MTIKVNGKGDAHARSLITSGKVDQGSSWSFSAEDGDKLLGADGDDWGNYAKWFLAEDTDAAEETKARFKYPFGKSGKIYRRAVSAIRSRASQQGATAVYDCAGELMDKLDKKQDDDSRVLEGALATRLAPIGVIENRAADLAPDSYDPKARSVGCTLSTGAAVKRMYGTEVLKISPDAINLDRLKSCGVPLIDSHNIFGVLDGVFGTLDRAWIEKGQLVGRVSFDDSEVGHKAEGLVKRGVVKGLSIGYRVDSWEVTDEDGNVIDPERDRMAFDEQYTFTGTRWELLELSMVSVPADAGAFFRSARALADDLPLGGVIRVIKKAGGTLTFELEPDSGTTEVDAVLMRMKARQAMLNRTAIIG